MNTFIYSYPVKVYFGEGAAKENLPAELAKYGKTVMLAYGGGSVIDCCKIISAQAKLPEDDFARSELIWAAAMAENGILKIGKIIDFQCHMIEHQLGAYTDCNHDFRAIADSTVITICTQEQYAASSLARACFD